MKIFSSTHDFEYDWNEVSTANWRKYSPWNKESSHVIAVDTLSRRIDPATGTLRTERLITCKQSAPSWVKPFLGKAEVSHVYEVSYVRPPLVPASIPLPNDATTTSSPPPSQINTTSRLPSSNNSPSSSQPNRSRRSLLYGTRNRDETRSTSAANDVNSFSQPSQRATRLTSPTSLATASPRGTPPRAQAPSVTMISQNLTWSELLSVHETVVYRPSPDNPKACTRFEQEARITALCGGWARIRERIETFTVERFDENAKRGRAGFEMVLEMSRKVFGEEKEKEKRLAKM